MQAKETKLQDIIEGTKQYVIPLFQRAYSWTEKEWDVLWKDILELCEADNPRTHFIGSIVNMPTVSVPEGVAKYLLIDGQQRLTTLFLLLTVLRNKAREVQNQEFGDEINNTLLVNPYKKGDDFLKLMPTQIDRETYKNYINGKQNQNENQLTKAYSFFDKKLKQIQIEPEKIKKIITNYLSLVSIVLDPDDNPYLVFESLNAKGRPLTQADLIRNYFFMRVHVDEQEQIYSDFWKPMQLELGEGLTEYIRHYLMKDGSSVKQSDVYTFLKEKVSTDNVVSYLKELRKYSIYYKNIIQPEFETEKSLQKYFNRLKRMDVTTVYPLLLNFYDDYENKIIGKEIFVEILKVLENYLIRRFICNISTNSLNKIFPIIYPQIKSKHPDNYVLGLKVLLQNRNYPKDNEFSNRLKDSKLYGTKDRNTKTKIILESLEEYFNNKERISFDNLTIEHIMPQTLTTQWKNILGADWQDTHELYLHTIGNLTLSAYNPELSNDDFQSKKNIFSISNLDINKYFSSITQWTKDEIEKRAELLVQKALEIWSYLGNDSAVDITSSGVKGTSPHELFILGQKFDVQSWRDVLIQTFNTISELEPEKFEIIQQNFPRYISKNRAGLNTPRELNNGYFMDVNLGAQRIQKLCIQAIETIELTSDEWLVVTS